MEEGGEDGVRVHSSKSRSVSVARRTSQVRSSSRAAASSRTTRTISAEDGGQGGTQEKQEGQDREADRTIITKMPKHLFSGKRGIGKTDREVRHQMSKRGCILTFLGKQICIFCVDFDVTTRARSISDAGT